MGPLPNGLNGLYMGITNYLLSGMILRVSLWTITGYPKSFHFVEFLRCFSCILTTNLDPTCVQIFPISFWCRGFVFDQLKQHKKKNIKTRWWFEIFFIFNLIPGEMIQFDKHIFQRGLNHQLENRFWSYKKTPSRCQDMGKGWELISPRRMGESRHIQPIYPGKLNGWGWNQQNFRLKIDLRKNHPFFWGGWGVRVPMDVKIISRMYLAGGHKIMATCHPCVLGCRG